VNPQEVEGRLNSDLEFFAEEAPLLVKDKQGYLVKWRLNIAQKFMQHRAEDQLRRRGWVRMLLLKGRQQGGSTWAGGRFYHRTRSRPGTSTFILSHEGKTTTKLFTMVERFHENVLPEFRPVLGKSNTNQMTFPLLGSDYAVGTAGNEHVGRGGTAQLFHGSEVAYWEKAYAIQEGALKSIAMLSGTEVILESTADGPYGLFYDKCMMALKNLGDYELCFVPWFWQTEYERDVEAGFALTEEEEEFAKTYFTKPFFSEQNPPSRERVLRKMAWRRAEILDGATANGGINLDAGRAKFRRVYPSNPVEAFLYTGIGLVQADAIMAARKSVIGDSGASLIAGVDPAGDSDTSDRTVIALRRGRVLEDVLIFEKMTPMRLAGIIANDIIGKRNAEMVFIDRGYGEGTVDRLRELQYGRRVIGVAFNEQTLYPDLYLNKRSEIIIECAKWLNARDVRIPDRDDIHADLACMPLDEETSNGLHFIKSKREIKKILGRSPDIFDAVALTFAYPVHRGSSESSFRKAESKPGFRKVGGPLKALSRMRGRTR
jgi:hypothetical protein